jgi:hypothetical protein
VISCKIDYLIILPDEDKDKRSEVVLIITHEGKLKVVFKTVKFERIM